MSDDYVLGKLKYIKITTYNLICNISRQLCSLPHILNLLTGLLAPHVQANDVLGKDATKRLFLYALCWGLGGLLETDERKKFHTKMGEILSACGDSSIMPVVKEDETMFEYVPDALDKKEHMWKLWQPGTLKAWCCGDVISLVTLFEGI